MRDVDVEIVKRSDAVKGFAVLPKRWIVERTISWLNRCRRLAKALWAERKRFSRKGVTDTCCPTKA